MDFLDELGLYQLWEKIKGLISSQTSNYAVDSAVVHIAGSETVTGPKTFSGGVTVASGAVISGGAEVSGRFAISSGGADFEIPSGDPNDATKFLRGDGAWAEITSAASADTITTTLPISLGGTGESTKNMAVSALFNDNVGSNASYLLGATSTFASAGYVDANDAKALLGITQSDIVSMIGTEPVASASTATDAASLGGVAASNYVTLNTDQNITGIKTFVGQKKIKFQQSGASDKLGFTLYNSAGVEQGYLEYNPTNKINGAPLMTLGNYASAAAGVSYVGFRKYSNITGSAGAYNLLTPLIADARTPFSLTTTYSHFFLPLGVTDGASMVMTDSRGVLNISALLPSGYTLPPATTTSIGGVVIGSGLDVTSAGGISVDSAYVSSAALDAVSSGGYITTSEASTIIADQISSGGYVTSSGTVASAGVADGLTATADSGYVHISGNEDISGTKVFVGNLRTSGANPVIQDTDSTWDITATSRTGTNKLLAALLDKNGYRIAGVEAAAYADGGRDIHYTMRNRANTGWINDFALYENVSGAVAAKINHKLYCANAVVSSSNDTGWGVENATYSTTLMIGNGGVNRGLWDKTLNKWMIYANASTVTVNGNCTGNAATASSCTGNAATATTAGNVTGTVALDHGGTGQTTRLGAAKVLTNENVGSAATHFVTLTTNWAKFGFSDNASVKAALGINNVDNTADANKSVAKAASCTGNAATATKASSCTGNAATASSCTGNAATATTATKASSCTGNAATATKASSCTGNSVSVTCSAYSVSGAISATKLPAGGTWAFFCTSGTTVIAKLGVSAGGTQLYAANSDYTGRHSVYCVRKT